MSILKSVPVDAIKQLGRITDTDALIMRRAFYMDGIISPEEADELIALNDRCHTQDPAWAELFVEALTDYIVNQALPEGYVTAANAEWLVERISVDGKIQTGTELELLVSVIEKARWAPASLAVFALAQVKHAVVSGEGALRSGLRLEPGAVGAGDVKLLRRILYGFGGDGNMAITRAEAEVLFAINDATAGAPNHPSWTDLFVKAIANAIMAASGYNVPSREEALRQEAWLDGRGELAPAGVLGKLITTGLRGIWGAYTRQTPEERQISNLERQRIEIIVNERITGDEANWLAERIGRDAKVTSNEQALLAFIKAESPSLDPALQGLIDRIGRAA